MKKLPSNYTYSELALMDDLSKYSLNEFINFFKVMKVKVIKKEPITIVELQDEFTEFLVHFTPKGKFIKIQTEHWKDIGMKYVK